MCMETNMKRFSHQIEVFSFFLETLVRHFNTKPLLNTFISVHVLTFFSSAFLYIAYTL